MYVRCVHIKFPLVSNIHATRNQSIREIKKNEINRIRSPLRIIQCDSGLCIFPFTLAINCMHEWVREWLREWVSVCAACACLRVWPFLSLTKFKQIVSTVLQTAFQKSASHFNSRFSSLIMVYVFLSHSLCFFYPFPMFVYCCVVHSYHHSYFHVGGGGWVV